MSQNDFTIANQGFPAFRADLNSALQALASNNSGATEPSTMFANMWWYDSANNIMYIRNEDNDAWIKFAELDQANDKFVLSGTLQLDDGTVSAPALTFNSDTNMGIYRGGTDILKFVTAGTDAITIDASQNVDINGTVTADGLTVSTDSYRQLLLTFPDSFTSKLQLGFSNFYLQGSGTTDELTIANNSSGQTKFINQSKTSMLIDNSGDISFYEDTGTTPKFFWDASEERLAIGNSSPDVPLEVQMTQNGGAPATSGTTQTYGILRLQGTTFTSALDFILSKSIPVGLVIICVGSIALLTLFPTSPSF